MEFIDLFAGIGGFRYGLEQNNRSKSNIGRTKRKQQQGFYTCVYSNEWDKYASQIYKKHYGECDTRDITKVPSSDIPEHDLLCAGFPCQAFSIAGKRKGFEDTRGTLFFEIARIIKEHRPMFLLLENVKGLISHDGGKTLETILLTLQELGYYVNIEVCNSKDFGVPQNRERIFFLCRKINVLESVGQNQKMTSCEQTIQEWLFQFLLNNLKEVEKQQETESKDSILASLLLKEINQNLKSKDGNISDGILMDMGEKCFQSTDEKWQNIDLLLKNIWEENYLGKNKYTISTVIKQIIGWRTFTYFQMLLSILTATVHLRKSSKNLWSEILLNLTLIKESTNYARLNDKTEEIIITEDGIAHLSSNFQDYGKNFIVGHLRGECAGQVFPIRKSGGENIGDVARTLNSSDWRGANRNQETTVIRTDWSDTQERWDKPNSTDSIRRTPYTDGMRIRRLTPTECERLQGFPDGWTAKGIIDGKEVEISDTQRYKTLGNAVTTNVITAIGELLNNSK